MGLTDGAFAFPLLELGVDPPHYVVQAPIYVVHGDAEYAVTQRLNPRLPAFVIRLGGVGVVVGPVDLDQTSQL